MKKRQIEKIEEIVSTETHYRVYCNLKKNIMNSLSSRDFSQSRFSRKIFVSTCLLC